MKNIPLLIGTILGTLILVVAIAFVFSGSSESQGSGQKTVDPLIAVGQARNVKIAGSKKNKTNINSEKSVDDTIEKIASIEATENDKNIITIVEFADFQCPACKASLPAVNQVISAYPGKVRLVYRHFPLESIHQNAKSAAIAAEAVASIDKNKFWGMHDLLFTNQEKWESIRNKKELNDTFATYAEKLDIDRTEFLERIEDNSVVELVKKDSNIAIQLGVNATPTFYVNGIKTSAPQLLKTVESLTVNK